MNPPEQRRLVETLRTDYSVRQICETLGFNKSTLYYQPKIDPCEEVLRTEIEQLAARYPKYGYRRITKVLVRMGYPVGYRRVARLMKSANLSVSVLSTLRHHGIEISVARRGYPWENGYAERLIRTLKEEEVHLNDYEDITEARERIGHFITQVYNQKRPHSALGYLTPVEFQQQNLS